MLLAVRRASWPLNQLLLGSSAMAAIAAGGKVDIVCLSASRSRLNAVFTMLAILIYGRLTETEQIKNNSSVSRWQSGGNHGPGQTKRLAAKARCGVPVPSRAPATTAYGRQRDCELPAVIRGQVRHVRRR